MKLLISSLSSLTAPKFWDLHGNDAAAIGATVVRFIFITKSANGICTDLTGF